MMRLNPLWFAFLVVVVGCRGNGTDPSRHERTGGADLATLASQTPDASSPDCRSYKSYTAALAKATIDCQGTVGPFLYGLNEKGLLERRFESCHEKTSTLSDSAMLLHIDRLLSLQLRKATLPNVM